MLSTAEFKKKPQGSFESDGYVRCTLLHDNSEVFVMSTIHTYQPVQNASRFKKGQGVLKVLQPILIQRYNEGMGVLIYSIVSMHLIVPMCQQNNGGGLYLVMHLILAFVARSKP